MENIQIFYGGLCSLLPVISGFSGLVAPSINKPEFSSDSTILIKLLKSWFEINEVNLFPALKTPVSLVFLSNFSFANEAALVANLCKTSLSKGKQQGVFSAFLPKLPITLPNVLQRNLPD